MTTLTPESMPEGIGASVELLMNGIASKTLSVVRQRMHDGGRQEVYDLAVADRMDDGRFRTVSIARLIPQPTDDDDAPAASTSDPLN